MDVDPTSLWRTRLPCPDEATLAKAAAPETLRPVWRTYGQDGPHLQVQSWAHSNASSDHPTLCPHHTCPHFLMKEKKCVKYVQQIFHICMHSLYIYIYFETDRGTSSSIVFNCAMMRINLLLSRFEIVLRMLGQQSQHDF